MSTRADDSAGASPKPMPAAIAIAKVIASTWKSGSTWISEKFHEDAGSDEIACVIQ